MSVSTYLASVEKKQGIGFLLTFEFTDGHPVTVLYASKEIDGKDIRNRIMAEGWLEEIETRQAFVHAAVSHLIEWFDQEALRIHSDDD